MERLTKAMDKYLSEAKQNVLDAKAAVKVMHPELHGKMKDRLVKLVAKQLNVKQ